MPTGENAFLKGLCRPADVRRRLTSQSDPRTPGSRDNRPVRLQHSSDAERSRLNGRLRGDNSSKCAECVPAFGLPVLPPLQSGPVSAVDLLVR